MKYKIVENDEIFDNINDVIDACIDEEYHEDDEYFEEWLNDMYSGVEIGNVYYSAYDILDNAGDGNMYDMQRDFCESQNESDEENARWELNRAKGGETIYIQAYTVEVIDEDETGDFDGDEPFDVASLRRAVEEQNARLSEDEIDVMSLFQRIGG